MSTVVAVEGIVLAIKAGNALLTLAGQAMEGANKYNQLAIKAANEGRDVSPEEIDALHEETGQIINQTSSMLVSKPDGGVSG